MPATLENVRVFDAITVLTPDAVRAEVKRIDEELWWAEQARYEPWSLKARIKLTQRRRVFAALLAKP